MIDSVSSINSLTKGAGTLGVQSSESSILSQAGTVVSAAASAALGPTFASVLGGAVNDAISAVKGGEAASFAGIKGTADTREVVDAVMEADRTLKTAVALRDKVVSAYLEITKMQI
ncbi:flagellar hook-basal body complex protein FliE [Rhizobium sp. S95]|uniref:Flagellar hook-basal body complex protein FliE n=1 Tax=Ciceribacter sichuanensis TaxID=2949647 RepID=A0AAJ1C1E2_9HYPH|nr:MULTISPECIES: flagellar hook-basal body complex protein FliE [unclassified Ciceribacter]MCM2396108.1 flagellar hook-basal body complex protein FliE [Ciceribacter sp. S95]MCO5959965.1 flagellar hook-basal body complex protein FliE [Ciceribacter sp. S101]